MAVQLRLNKVSELIHNSEHHRNLDTAQVAVHFQEIVDTVRACTVGVKMLAVQGTGQACKAALAEGSSGSRVTDPGKGACIAWGNKVLRRASGSGCRAAASCAREGQIASCAGGMAQHIEAGQRHPVKRLRHRLRLACSVTRRMGSGGPFHGSIATCPRGVRAGR